MASSFPSTVPASDASAVLRWHAGWAAGVLLAGIGITMVVHRGPGGFPLALVVGLAPSLIAWALGPNDSPRSRDLLLFVWAVCGALGCGLAGGVAGPLAIWCAAPMVAAVVLGGSRRMALGAAFSLLSVAIVALAQTSGWVRAAPTGAAAMGLGLVGAASITVGLAAAMLSAQRRGGRGAETPAAQTKPDTVLDHQPCLILALSEDGRVEDVFGGSFEPRSIAHTLRQDGLLALAEGEDRTALEAARAEACAEGAATLTFRLAPKTETWLAIALRRRPDGRLAAVLRDATGERRREMMLEAARAEAEALNVGKSRFLANMSHELRTPLNAIMGFSDVMRQRIFGDLPPRYAEYAELIHDAGAHLLDLINDVLDMSKIEAERFELFRERLDAREPVQAALRLMRLQADDAGVQLRGVLPGAEVMLSADRRALKQIVLNLVSNALKFTPKGGLVSVSLDRRAEALELTVADTGLGIAAEDLERLGRPFEQAGDQISQGKGTGLGLSLVRSLAELHGGEMVIESRLGEGTAVTVRLPAPAVREADDRPVAEPERAEV